MKKLLLGLGLAIVLAGIGYFFIYPYDYVIRFKADTNAGTINQTIKVWDRNLDSPGDPIEQEDLNHLTQFIREGDSVHRYRWAITRITDSTSEVRVGIRDLEHSLQNKWQVLWGGSSIQAISEARVRDFIEGLKEHLGKIRIHIDGEAELPSTFYAYVDLQTSQHRKAAGMMDYHMLLSGELARAKVSLNGPPMVVVDHWDMDRDSLRFEFCYPIIRSERLPEHPEIRYKRIFPKPALKATYNGNYITSDRAWYALLDYAASHGLEVEPTPVEVFHNNPNMGGDALQWTAEIYLPLKESE